MSTSAETPEERSALAGEYVLGTLPHGDRDAAERRIATDADFARDVARWTDRLLPLNAMTPAITPPPRLWERIERTLGLAPRPATRWAVSGGLWRSLALWRGLAAGGLVAASVLAMVLATRPAEVTTHYVVVLATPQDKAPGWIIQAGDAREVSLIPLGRFEVPPGKSLQFWTKADDWRGPVSLGLVQPGRRLQVKLDRLPALVPNQLFELTLEPYGGSPMDRPTGPIQFIGRAVKVM